VEKYFEMNQQMERLRIQSMLSSLPPFQQQQIANKVNDYRASLAANRYPPSLLADAVFEFQKTMVTYLYDHSAGRQSLSSTVPPPPPQRPAHAFQSRTAVTIPQPPPPKSPHPLATTQPGYIKAATRVSAPQQAPSGLVDKSGGLLASLMRGAAIPVGLQDWVNQLYFAVEKKAPAIRPKADSFVTDTIRQMQHSGQLWRMHWIAYPVPTLSQLDKACGEPMVIDLEKPPSFAAPDFTVDYVPFEPVTKKKKQSPPAAIVSVAGPKKLIASPSGKVSKEEQRKRNERAMKFKEHLEDNNAPSSPEPQITNVQYEFGNDEEDVFEKTEQYSVIGTCKKMEKRYLRLTSAPDPSLVRPESVLREWLKSLTSTWRTKVRDWKYIEDQMRAIRQDLTVQNLRGDFTLLVYETNARWSLEAGDLGQFNQCQTQLKQLHAQSSTSTSLDTRCEFISYRLLYYYLQSLRVDEQIFLNQILNESAVREHRYVKFALTIRKAATTNNFVKYFSLCRMADSKDHNVAASHTHHLLAAFESRQRLFALTVLTKAFVTQLSIPWVASVLGFGENVEECLEFVVSHGGVLKSTDALDPKNSNPKFANSPLLVGSKFGLMG